MSKNNLCNNCGKQGHQFHQCKLPITSYGIILFRSSTKGIQYLMIRRKDSFGYIDFIRGKYVQNNLEHLQSIFNEKSPSEKESEFYRFMAELSIMQTIPALLVTYSSNVGRYLYLTSPSTTRIKSLDLPKWTL